MARSTVTITVLPANSAAPTLAELERGAIDLTPYLTVRDPWAPQLYPGDLFQVLDNGQTWHAATVGEGVLCHANRDVSVRTERWEYGTDRVDCWDPRCRLVLGRL